MTISLGAVMGGPEKTIAVEAFRSLSQKFESARKKTGPSLNVVFHFPGTLIEPDYSGLRTGRFSKAQQKFMIQVAVPKEIASSENRIEAEWFMISAIREALELARPRWSKHDISFPYVLAYNLIEKIERRIESAQIT